MIELTGTVDIECADWDRFKIAATYDGVAPKIHDTIGDLVDYLGSRGGTWWAHCGGQYDGLAIVQELNRRKRPAQIDYPRSRMTRVVFGRTTLRDSYGLLPFSLEVIAAMSGERAPALPWGCICRLGCAGYCQIPKRSARELADYVVADCRVLYRGLCELIDFAYTHGIDLRGTIGGSAWATAQRTLSIADASFTPQMWDMIHPADKGGRTVLARPTSNGPGTHRDISSAYPAALASVSLPTGAPRVVGGRDASMAFLSNRAGIFTATVDIPPSFLPPLPWRHGNRIRYPHGAIRGTWPANELHAAEDRGVKILDVRSGVIWSGSRVLFGPLIRHWYQIRSRCGKRSPFGRWMRELANSLTGKFSERPERRTIRMHPKFDSIVICRRTGACRNGCNKSCGYWECLDKWGTLWAQPYYRTAPSGHLHWAAYLKAATRIAWLTEAERHGPEHLVSGNTDSIWTTSRNRSIPEGRALGAWETKNTWTEWEARSPSCYRYRDSSSGNIVIRASGAGSMTDTEWKAGMLDRSRGVETLIEAARHGQGLFHRKNAKWTLPGAPDQEWYGDRKLDASGLVTWPVDADELRDRTSRHLAKQLRDMAA